MPENDTNSETVNVTVKSGHGEITATAKVDLGTDNSGPHNMELEFREGTKKVPPKEHQSLWGKIFHPNHEPVHHEVDDKKGASWILKVDGKIVAGATAQPQSDGYTGVHAGKTSAHVDHEGHIIKDVSTVKDPKLAQFAPELVAKVKEIMLPNGAEGAAGKPTVEQFAQLIKIGKDIESDSLPSVQADLPKINTGAAHGK